MSAASAWALLPVLVVVLGFALRQHPARVVLAAAVAAGVVAGMHWREWLETLGQSFLNVRYLLVLVFALAFRSSTLLVLPFLALELADFLLTATVKTLSVPVLLPSSVLAGDPDAEDS